MDEDRNQFETETVPAEPAPTEPDNGAVSPGLPDLEAVRPDPGRGDDWEVREPEDAGPVTPEPEEPGPEEPGPEEPGPEEPGPEEPGPEEPGPEEPGPEEPGPEEPGPEKPGLPDLEPTNPDPGRGDDWEIRTPEPPTPEPPTPEPPTPEPPTPEPPTPEPPTPEPPTPEPPTPEPPTPEPPTPEPPTPEPPTPEPPTPEPPTPEPPTPEPPTPEPPTPEPPTPEPPTPEPPTPEPPTPEPPTPEPPTPEPPTPEPPTPEPPNPGPDNPDPKPPVDSTEPNPINEDQDDDRKYHCVSDTLQQMAVTDENGVTKQVWVAQIEADRDLYTTGPDGETVTVANVGDRGGYVEVPCGEDGYPLNANGERWQEGDELMLPVPPGEDGVEDSYGEGLKGLSQNGMSWVHEGSVVVGNASVRDDAQIVGPDTIISGNDKITEEVGVGGKNYRSCGSCEFTGNGSYVDMDVKPGAEYSFEGGSQVGGPVTFEAGSGRICDGEVKDPETGEVTMQSTMIFAARDGSQVTVQLDGAETNGLTALDDTDLKGSFKGCPGLIVQDSTVETNAVFDGEAITIVNQDFSVEADGLTVGSDEELDSLTPLTGGQADLGTDLAGGYNTHGSAEDQADYLRHVEEIIAHEQGENFKDTVVQHHYDDVHAEKHAALTEQWEALKAEGSDMSREEFAAKFSELSAYHDGINDAASETYNMLLEEGGNLAVGSFMDEQFADDEELKAQLLEGGDEAIQAYLDENGIEANIDDIRKAGGIAAVDSYMESAAGIADEQFHGIRAEAQTDEMYFQASSESQYAHDGNPYTETEKSDHAMDGLMADEGAGITPQSKGDAKPKFPSAPSDWKAAAKSTAKSTAKKVPAGFQDIVANAEGQSKENDGMERC